MFLYQFVHSSESILGVRKIFTAFTVQVYTHFLSKTGYDQWIFFKEKLKVISSQKHVGFSAERYIFCSCLFLFLFLFHEVFCYLNMCIFLWGIFAMHIQGILLPKHKYIDILWGIFLLHTCISKVFSYLNTHTYILWGMTTFRACACFI